MKMRSHFIPALLGIIALATLIIPRGEAGATSTFTIHLNADGTPSPIDSRLLGSNLPAWLGPTNFANNTFEARAIASGVSELRIPGGSWSDDYGWVSCELGANQPGAYPCGQGWESWASKPTDFINFARATGKPAMYTINVNVTAQEAAAAVAFFNGSPSDTRSIGLDRKGTDWLTVGHWAQLRVNHGNAQPASIQYWEFGNEVYGGTPAAGGTGCVAWGWENSWTCDGTEYVYGNSTHDGYLAVRAAMRAVDPTIHVGAVGTENPSDYTNWGNKVITGAGSVMDFYIVHPYAYYNLPSDYPTILAQPQAHWAQMKSDLQAAFNAHAGGRQIPLAATEYNLVSSSNQDTRRLMNKAINMLFIADSLAQAIQNGYAAADQWDLANGCDSNTHTCYDLLQVDNGFRRAPGYYAFPIWSRFGNQALAVTSDADPATTLSVYGGRIDSNTLSLLAINKTGAPLSANVIVDGTFSPVSGTVDVVQATSLDATTVTFNGVGNPSDDLSNAPPSPLHVTNPLAYTFPPYSITLLRLSSQGGPTIIENDDPSVQYNGWRGARDVNASGSTYRASKVKNDKVSFKFKGALVTWVTRKGPDQGKTRVVIDGVSRGTIDLFSPTVQWKVPLAFGGLANVNHTLVIQVLGTKNASATDTNVTVDAFSVGGILTEDSACALKYNTWTCRGNTRASGGSYGFNVSMGAMVSLSFNGPSLSWITARGPSYGKAQVLIDGVNQGTIDLYAGKQQWDVVKTYSGLSAGWHTIQIKVLGTKNAASKGRTVVVDAFNGPITAIGTNVQVSPFGQSPSTQFSFGQAYTPVYSPYR